MRIKNKGEKRDGINPSPRFDYKPHVLSHTIGTPGCASPTAPVCMAFVGCVALGAPKTIINIDSRICLVNRLISKKQA